MNVSGNVRSRDRTIRMHTHTHIYIYIRFEVMVGTFRSSDEDFVP